MDLFPTLQATTPMAGPGRPRAPLKEQFELFYGDLCRIARGKLRFERIDHTFDTAALVHEAYFKLSGQAAGAFENASQFLAVATMAMRRILINYARDRKRQKRGGDLIRMTYGSGEIPVETTPDEILALHEALKALRALNHRQALVVEYHFFGGFSHPEIAASLGISVESVRRDWRLARAWLSTALRKAA